MPFPVLPGKSEDDLPRIAEHLRANLASVQRRRQVQAQVGIELDGRVKRVWDEDLEPARLADVAA